MSANGSSGQEAGQPSEQPAAATSPAPAGQAQPRPWAQGRPRAPLAPQQMVAPQRPQGGRGMRPQAAQLPGPPRPHLGHPAHNMAPLPGGLQPGRGAPPPFGAPPFRGAMPRPPEGGMLRPLPMPPQGRPPFRPPPPHQAPPGWGMPRQPQPPHPPHGFGGPPMARPPGPGMVQMGPGGPAGFLGPPVPPTPPPHHMSQSTWLSAPGGAPAARSEGARPDQHAAERPVQAKPGVVQKPAVLEKPAMIEKPASVEGRPEAATAGSGQQQEQNAQSQPGGAAKPQQPSAADVAAAWSAHKADDGKVYYHNTLSGESSWTKPQDFKGEDATAGTQPVPVSSTDVQGTEWAEVSCSDGKVYYYNATSKETTWQKPQAVADSQARGEAQEQQMKRAGFTPAHAAIIARLKASNAPALNLRPDLRAVEETDDDATFTEADIEREPGAKGAAQQPVRQPVRQPEEAEAVSRYEGPGRLPQLAPQPPVSHSALPGPQQRGMQPPPPADGRLPHMVHPGLQTLGPNPAQGGPAPPQGPPPVPRGPPHAFGGRPPPGLRGHLSGRSNGGQALPPPLPPPKTHAELVAEYKELLLESQVTAFSCWEKVLPKLVEDSRYKAIPTPKERRQVFDDFCRNVAAEQKAVQARKEMQRAAAVPAFKALLDEAQRYQPGPPLPREQPGDQIEAGAKGDRVGKSSSPQPTAEAGKGSRKRERSPEARNGRERSAKDSSRADKESSRKRSARDEADRGSRRAEDSHSDRHRSSRGSDARRGSPAERDKRRKKDSPKPERARDSKSARDVAGSGKQAGRQPGTAEGSSAKRDAQKEAAAAPGLSPAAAPAAAGPSGSTKQQDGDSTAAAAVAPEAGRHSGAAQKAPEAELAAGDIDSAAQGANAELPPPPPPGAPTAVSGPTSDGDIQASGPQAGEEEDPPEDMEVDPNPAGLGATTTYEEFEHSWADDPRWQQCSEAIRRELFQERTAVLKAQADEAAAAQKALQEKEFRAMLQELHLHPRTKWLTLKGRLRDDKRYRAVPRGNREGVFNSFLAELEKSERAAREEQRAAEDRRRALNAAQQEATRRQREAAHTDAVAGYQTLLAEVVKDPNLRWIDCRDKLLKDPQGRASRPEVPTREQQQLFEKHIQDLRASLDVEFRQLLDQVLRPLLDPDSDGKSLPLPFRDFQEAVRLLEEDPRFHRVPEADRKDLWNKWVTQLVRELKDPGVAAASKALKGGSSRGAERDRERQAKEAGIDKAYLREYFEPDQKRMRPT